MEVFQKNQPRRPPSWSWSDAKERFLNIQLHLRPLLRTFCVREQVNLGLWVPTGIAAGIALYFSLPTEPYLGWSLVSLGGATLGAYLLRHQGWFSILAALSFCAALGFVAAQVRTMSVAAPVLQNELRAASLSGRVVEASRNQEGGTTLLLTPSAIGGLAETELPGIVRLRVRQEHDPIWPGGPH